MNFVLVTGSNKSRRSLAENVVNFCIEELMPRMRTLDIEVKIRSMKDEDAIGFCLETDNNRTFEIDAERTLDEENFIETICHEMVHVWQNATRRMKEKSTNRLWLCKDGKYRNYTNCDYYRQPWEVQAYRMQEGLKTKFMESNLYDK